MSLYKERKYLIIEGFKLPKIISFDEFKAAWIKHFDDNGCPDAILREFREDYLTSEYRSVISYLKDR